jgi:hypothetical protein
MTLRNEVVITPSHNSRWFVKGWLERLIAVRIELKDNVLSVATASIDIFLHFEREQQILDSLQQSGLTFRRRQRSAGTNASGSGKFR